MVDRHNHNECDGLKRRTFLKASGVTGFGFVSGVGSASAKDDTEFLDAGDLGADVSSVLRTEETRKLVTELRNRGYRMRRADAAGIAVTSELVAQSDIDTDDLAVFDEANATSVFLPFNKAHSEDRAVLNALVVDADGNQRVPASAWAIEVSEPSDQTSVAHVDVIAFEPADGVNVATAGQTDRQAVTIDSFDVRPSNDAGTMSLLATCPIIATELCRRYGSSATYTQCASICTRVANPWYVVGCRSFCVGLVAVINRYGCYQTGAVLCSLVNW